jgi:hypothetical protein
MEAVMQLLVFITDDGSPEGTGPTLFVPTHPQQSLPINPRAMQWRYLATIDERDQLFSVHGPNALDAVCIRGHFITSRLPVAPQANERSVAGREVRLRHSGSITGGGDFVNGRAREFHRLHRPDDG